MGYLSVSTCRRKCGARASPCNPNSPRPTSAPQLPSPGGRHGGRSADPPSAAKASPSCPAPEHTPPARTGTDERASSSTSWRRKHHEQCWQLQDQAHADHIVPKGASSTHIHTDNSHNNSHNNNDDDKHDKNVDILNETKDNNISVKTNSTTTSTAPTTRSTRIYSRRS